MRRRRATLLGAGLAAAVGILGACGGGTPPSISASTYDQTCAQASDCVGVHQTDFASSASVCCALDCGAINKKDEARYAADYTADSQSVSSSACDGVDCPSSDCARTPVACVKGKCAIRGM